MPSKALVRPAQLGDIENLLRLAPITRASNRRNSRLRCFVIEAGNSLAGYATCTRDFFTWRAAEYLHMDCLYIDPAYRDAGLGAEMMRLMARNARALDCAMLQAPFCWIP